MGIRIKMEALDTPSVILVMLCGLIKGINGLFGIVTTKQGTV